MEFGVGGAWADGLVIAMGRVVVAALDARGRGTWLGFEDVLAGAGEAHIFAGYAFDGGGIGF